MTNTHYAVITTSVPPAMQLIASGPEDFCRGALSGWVAKYPLGEYDEAEVLARVDQPLRTRHTTSTGTTITIEDRHDFVDGKYRAVILDNPNAPEDLRHGEAGRIIGGGFQPAPFAEFALSAEALHIIADLIEQEPRP